MGNFRKYPPPPSSLAALPPGQDGMDGDVDVYQENSGLGYGMGGMGMGDPFMGGGLPPPDFYGVPKQQWNAEMMDRLIDTTVKIQKDKDGVAIQKPKLWLFDTEAFRHLQLTNLRSRDQTEIERDICDIQMLSHQDGNDQMCEEMQQRVYAKIAMFKSRSDLPIQHRERDAWFTNVSELKTQEIKRPQGTGGFFSDIIGKKRRDY